MWSKDRSTLRRVFFDGWRHFRAGQPLQGAEGLAVEALLAHPEYQPLMVRNEDVLDADMTPNPFLHMSLHIALHEQLTTDRPAGIRRVYERLRARRGHEHDAQHAMMACLEETLWQAQSSGQMPDERTYLHRLQELLGDDGAIC